MSFIRLTIDGAPPLCVTLAGIEAWLGALGFAPGATSTELQVQVWLRSDTTLFMPLDTNHPHAEALVEAALITLEETDPSASLQAVEFFDDLDSLEPLRHALSAVLIRLWSGLVLRTIWRRDRTALRLGNDPDSRVGIFIRPFGAGFHAESVALIHNEPVVSDIGTYDDVPATIMDVMRFHITPPLADVIAAIEEQRT